MAQMKNKAPAQPNQTVPKSAKPGDPAVEAKKDRPSRVYYPGLKPGDDGKPTVKLDEYPSDFDPKVHKPLRKVDFKNDAPYLEHKADELEERARKYRQEAEEARTLGSQADRANAKRLRAMTEKVAELRAKLAAQGIDVDALIPDVAQSTSTESHPEPEPVNG